MAGVKFRARTNPITTGTSAKTLLQIVAASNHAVLIKEIGIDFNGVANTDPAIRVDVLRQTDAGTMTTSASSIVKDPDDAAETLQTTIQDTATSQPSSGDILMTRYVHPQSGFDWAARFGEEIKIGGGDRLGIRVTASVSVSAAVSVRGEE